MSSSVDVLILGGGFAGRNATAAAARAGGPRMSVRLVDAKSASEFSPLYPDLVSGRMDPRGLRGDLSEFCARVGAEFVQAKVTAIDLDGRRVETSAGDMHADVLVLCLGCVTNFYGNDAMRDGAVGLKTIAEGVTVQRACRRHVRSYCERDELFNFVVVGGGYTGIETASHMALLLRRLGGFSWERLRRLGAITVLEAAPRVLSMLPESVAAWAVEHITAYGIEIRTGVSAEAFTGGGAVRLTDGSTLANALVVWTAGVTPGPECAALAVPTIGRGRLVVDGRLRVDGHERVFAAGDLAGAVRPGETEPIRMAVQFSRVGGMVAGGNAVATITGRALKTFNPVDPGYVVPLAHGLGAGKVFGWECHGRLPYDLHYLMATYRSWSWPNRRAVMADWLGRGAVNGRAAECRCAGRTS